MRWLLIALPLAAGCAKGSLLRPGDAAPSVALPSQDGRPVSLADYRGRKILVWFYPAADTPG